MLAAGGDYGRSDIGQGEKVNVEYVSANPTGPMHVGHGRGAVFGDALANLLAFAGYDVTREYYINDAGAQVDVLARSAFLRYREALGENIGAIPDGLYPGDYLKPVGAALAAEHGATLQREAGSRMAADRARQGHRHDDGHDPRRSRRAQRAARRVLLGALADRGRRRPGHAPPSTSLRASGEVYEGRLPPPKGGNLEDWEDREQTLFRSTDFGDDVDRPLKKSDGSYTYFASDIAYHKSKFDRGFRNLIDVWGADHGGYIKRMQAAVKAVSGGKAALDVKLVQLVRLLRAGEPVKMSKRSGDFVTLREVVDEVGTRRRALRHALPQERRRARFRPRQGDRAQPRQPGVLRAVRPCPRRIGVPQCARGDARPAGCGPCARAAGSRTRRSSGSTDSGELSILRRIALYPRLVEAAALAHEPHRVAFYLYELASEFHAHWTRGKDLPHLRFIIQNDPETTAARLALVQGIVTVLASGLALLGVEAPEEMR